MRHGVACHVHGITEILLTPSKRMSICSFCIRRSDVPWDVPSHVLEVGRRKMVPFLKRVTCRSPHLRVKPPYRSMIKFPAPPTKFSAQQRMFGESMAAACSLGGVDGTLGTEGIR